VRDRLGLHAAVPTAAESAVHAPNDTLVVDRAAIAETTAVPTQGGVVAATKRRRRRWPWVVAVLGVAVIAAGVLGWYLAIGRYTGTPNVVGLTKAAATAKLEKAGLKAHWLTPVYSDTIDKGLVADEHPGPGHDLRKGGTVNVALSLGRDHVPDVRNKTVDEATSILTRAQLTVPETRRQYSSTIDKNHVITTNPRPGTEVSPHSAVVLIVSDGPAPVTVPDVRNKPFDQAKSILEALGLHVTITKTFDDQVPENSVISTNPPAGATARQGDVITLVVSKGPHLYPVPDVRGMKVDDAVNVLKNAGFKVNVNQFPAGPGRVLSESPGPGSKQKRGTTVTLYVF